MKKTDDKSLQDLTESLLRGCAGKKIFCSPKLELPESLNGFCFEKVDSMVGVGLFFYPKSCGRNIFTNFDYTTYPKLDFWVIDVDLHDAIRFLSHNIGDDVPSIKVYGKIPVKNLGNGNYELNK